MPLKSNNKPERPKKKQKTQHNTTDNMIECLKEAMKNATPKIISKPWFCVNFKNKTKQLVVFVYENNSQKDQIKSLFKQEAFAYDFEVVMRTVPNNVLYVKK